MQSDDDAQLKALGRPHNYRQAQQAVSLSRRAGFDNISVDLMYGLPNQSRGAVDADPAQRHRPQGRPHQLLRPQGRARHEALDLQGLREPPRRRRAGRYVLLRRRDARAVRLSPV
ncbi:MAG: hypothetical protein ACLUFI_12170 [Oscillospiraceae bacterium]